MFLFLYCFPTCFPNFPPLQPCYLFAAVAGDLVSRDATFTTSSGRAVALRVFAEPHNASKTAFALDSLAKAMAWDEQRYGLEYDLDVFNIVAVDAFNMGAMENKSLKCERVGPEWDLRGVVPLCLTSGPTTPTRRRQHLQLPPRAGQPGHRHGRGLRGDRGRDRARGASRGGGNRHHRPLFLTPLSHRQYFHNYTGNRVTCRDWFQLSLKEGLTVYRDQVRNLNVSTSSPTHHPLLFFLSISIPRSSART